MSRASGVEDPAVDTPMLEGASVLVIDDEEIMREILQTLLDREGCHVSVAASGDALMPLL